MEPSSRHRRCSTRSSRCSTRSGSALGVAGNTCCRGAPMSKLTSKVRGSIGCSAAAIRHHLVEVFPHRPHSGLQLADPLLQLPVAGF